MGTEQLYPSTFDCAPMMGAQEDGVLLCMENAMKRYRLHGTVGTYITMTGDVCALGAVYAESGISVNEVRYGYTGDRLYHQLEHRLSSEAKEAIALLNKAAMELYPGEESETDYQGQLEVVNEEAPSELAAKRRVLRIYRHVIAKRKEA